MRGVGGLLASSLEDLTRWAVEDRAEIDKVAAPDGTVTIVFSDIEDSTALNERLGDVGWVRLLDAHDKLVRAHVDRNGGHVVKSQGDGFMIAFGDSAAAVRACIGVQESLRRNGVGVLRRTRVSVRIGAHEGRAVSRDGDWFGINVAIAARVAAQAAAGEILVTDEVRASVSAEFSLADPREVELKGLNDSRTLWRVVG